MSGKENKKLLKREREREVRERERGKRDRAAKETKMRGERENGDGCWIDWRSDYS